MAAGAFLALNGETLNVACAGLPKNAASKAAPIADLKLIPTIATECVSNACCKMNDYAKSVLVGANGLEPLTLSV